MQEDKRVILLLSGGIDSTVLLYWLIERNYEVFPFIVNYGQITFEKECETSINILQGLNMDNLFKLNISEMSQIGKGALIGQYPKDVTSYDEWYKSEFYPNRNLILLTLATNYAYKLDINNIAIGVVGESYKDTSIHFLNSFEECIRFSLKKINVIAPFAEKERIEVIKQAVSLKVPIEKTFSCNALANRHCMLCSSCYAREIALRQMEILLKK